LFDTVIVSATTATGVAEAFYLIALAGPTRSVTFGVTTPPGPPFTPQFAVRLGSGPVSQYVSSTIMRCSYVVAPRSLSLPAGGGTFHVKVSTEAGCPWSASSASSFISVLGSSSFTGLAFATFNLSPNTAAGAVNRRGTVLINFPPDVAQDVTISQPAQVP
jgi:hypothetical protein